MLHPDRRHTRQNGGTDVAFREPPLKRNQLLQVRPLAAIEASWASSQVGVEIPPQAAPVPRSLDVDQRYVLRELVEQSDDPRGAAVFGLGYWAGCRVSDVSWLL